MQVSTERPSEVWAGIVKMGSGGSELGLLSCVARVQRTTVVHIQEPLQLLQLEVGHIKMQK